jgi:hypothetical protein
MQDKETHHRIIVGKDYYEPLNIEPQVWAYCCMCMCTCYACWDTAGCLLAS